MNTIREIWGNARNHLAEPFHPRRLDFFKRILTDDQPGLKIFTSVDENESPAVIDVAEQLFRVISVPPNAEPENVHGHAELSHRQLRCFTDYRVSPITCDHQVGGNLLQPVGSLHHNAGDSSSVPEQVSGFMLHAQIKRLELPRIFRYEV